MGTSTSALPFVSASVWVTHHWALANEVRSHLVLIRCKSCVGRCAVRVCLPALCVRVRSTAAYQSCLSQAQMRSAQPKVERRRRRGWGVGWGAADASNASAAPEPPGSELFEAMSSEMFELVCTSPGLILPVTKISPIDGR